LPNATASVLNAAPQRPYRKRAVASLLARLLQHVVHNGLVRRHLRRRRNQRRVRRRVRRLELLDGINVARVGDHRGKRLKLVQKIRHYGSYARTLAGATFAPKNQYI
jgi:hypothetical protein